MIGQKVRGNDRKSQMARVNAIAISYLLIASTMSMVFFMNNVSAVPQMVELKCGNAFTGMGNVVYGGVDLPVGCFVEIYNNNTGVFTGKTFKIGDGTEGPPGVFKAGQFDFTASFDSTELPIAIFLRAYNSNTVAGSTTYGDSSVMTVDSSVAWSFPGWSLMASAPNVTVLSPNGGEILKGGSAYNITWNATDPDGFSATPISIYYSSDSGASWILVATNESNDGLYTWSVPAISSVNCLVRVVAQDLFGGIGSDESDNPFTIDSDLPASNIDSIALYWHNPSPLTITATASDATSGVQYVEFWYRYRIRPGAWQNWTLYDTDYSSPYSTSFTWPNGEAEYELYSIAVDNAGNREIPPASADEAIGLDSVPPSSSVNPISPYWIGTSPLTLVVTANYTVATIQKIEFWYRFSSNNATWGAWTKVFEDATSPYTHDFVFPGGNGYYEFYSRGLDTAGNYEDAPASADAICAFDNVAPTSSVNVISPYWQTVSPLTITATATDLLSGIQYISLYYRYSANNATWGSWALYSNDTASPWSWDFTFPSGNGYYEFYTRAVDNNGNMEAAPASRDALCAFDNVAPLSSVDIITPYWRNTAVTLTATAMDATDGVTSVELWYSFSTDNSTWGSWANVGTDTESPWSWNFAFSNGNGYYQFYTRARDAAGNYESAPASADAICGYDTTMPTSSVDITGTYWINTSPITITATASDVISGMASVELWYRHSTDNSTWSAWTMFGTDTSSPWSWSFGFPSGTGYYELYTRAIDRATNYEAAPGSADARYAYDTASPMVTLTAPANGQTNVGLTANIVVTFNKAMNIGSIAYNCMPNPGGWSVVWSAGDTVATFSHSIAFAESTAITFEITAGTDVAGNALVAGPVPNPWTFTTGDFTAPFITATTFADGATGVSTTAGVYEATWSEPMDTTAGTVTTNLPNATYSWPTTSTYRITYTALAEMTMYTITYNNFRDPALNAATGDLAKEFTTGDFTAPYITATTFADGATGVAVTAGVYEATWSEAMDTSVGTVTTNLPGATFSWPTTSIYRITYTALAEMTMYTITYNNFRDANLVAATGDLAKEFTTGDFTAPYITATTFADGATGVAVTAGVYEATWSEAMDTTVGTVTTNLPGATYSWPSTTVFRITYTVLAEMTTYTITYNNFRDSNLVAATGDLAKEFTTGDFTAPYIVSTVPMDAATGVTLSQSIIVNFSEAMNTGTVSYSITPDPGGLSVSWSSGNSIMTITHNAFVELSMYTVEVTAGQDLAGNVLAPGAAPNPWSFTTGDFTAPYIISTNPASGSTGVMANQDIVVTFSEAMNTGTVTYTLTPNPGGLTSLWSAGDTVLTITHSAFTEMTSYTVHVTGGQDVGGNSLVAGLVLNPWSFTTGDYTPPTIISTVPADSSTGISVTQSIQITFSEAISTGTFAYSCTPDPSGWTVSWSSGNTVATLTHTAFAYDTLYTFTVTSAQDVAGNSLSAGAVPNPFTFRTTLGATSTATGPVSGIATNVVDVTITYTFTGAPTSVNIYYTTDNGATWFSAGNDVTIDGSFAFTLAVSGTYGWIAQAVGGGSSEPSPPPAGTPPEAAPYMLDIIAPTSSAGPLPLYVNSLTFDVPFTAADNVGGSGVAYVNLYWKYSTSTVWQDYGSFTTSPISFTAPSGGRYYFFTIATDNAGNQEAMKDTAEADTLIDTMPPQPPTNLAVHVNTNGTATITWTHSTSPDRSYYNIYISNDAYMFNSSTPFATSTGTSWVHADGGNVDVNYYYIVRTVDIAGNEETNTNAVGKFVASIEVGWNLFSLPVIPPDNSVAGIFGSSLTGGTTQAESDRIFSWSGSKWQVAYYYDDGMGTSAWLFVGGSFDILPDRGYWIYIKEDPQGDYPTASHPPQKISLTGSVPGSRSASLTVGWNLVGWTGLKRVAITGTDESGLYASGFTGGASQAESDRVFYWTGSTWQIAYLYEDGDPANTGWIFVSGVEFELAPGKGYWIEIRDTHSPFVWTQGAGGPITMA